MAYRADLLALLQGLHYVRGDLIITVPCLVYIPMSVRYPPNNLSVLARSVRHTFHNVESVKQSECEE